MRYPAAVNYLFSFLNFEHIPFQYQREFNLKRMSSLLDWFDHPEFLFSSVLVAGTKGKGSTAHFLASILTRNGYSAGLYTSPHLSDPRERIRMNGRAISKNDFAKLVSKIRLVVRRRRKEIPAYGPITYFEVFTLLAILYFAEKRIDIGIFEVGLGGRLDATNVLEPLISVMTPISFDHEEHLGKTLRAIAREKAAIIKTNGCVVSANQAPEARYVIQKRIRKQKAKGYFLGASFRTAREVISIRGGRFDFAIGSHYWRRLEITLPGRFQIKNAAVALAVTSVLENQFRFIFKEKKIRQSLRTAFWPGRFEILKRRRGTVILDGAHNGASMNEVRSTLETLFPNRKVIVIFGISREKNLKAVLKPLLPRVLYFIVTKSNNPRAQEPKVILETLSKMGYQKPTFWAPHLKEAFQIAEKLTWKKTILLITGSLFLVSEAREILGCRKFI